MIAANQQSLYFEKKKIHLFFIDEQDLASDLIVHISLQLGRLIFFCPKLVTPKNKVR